jgi:hypothetical protein
LSAPRCEFGETTFAEQWTEEGRKSQRGPHSVKSKNHYCICASRPYQFPNLFIDHTMQILQQRFDG